MRGPASAAFADLPSIGAYCSALDSIPEIQLGAGIPQRNSGIPFGGVLPVSMPNGNFLIDTYLPFVDRPGYSAIASLILSRMVVSFISILCLRIAC